MEKIPDPKISISIQPELLQFVETEEFQKKGTKLLAIHHAAPAMLEVCRLLDAAYIEELPPSFFLTQSGKALKHNILTVAASVLQTEADALDMIDGVIVDKGSEVDRMGLEELATMVQFRTHEIPNDIQPEFVVTRHFRVKGTPFVLTNGVQAPHVEVDINTGFIKLLKHFIVEDCGTVINPQLVDEQIRGGVVQVIGGALL